MRVEQVFNTDQFWRKVDEYMGDLNAVHLKVNGVYTEITAAELREAGAIELLKRLIGGIEEAKVDLYVKSEDFQYVPVVQICLSDGSETEDYVVE